ncbi:MAG: DUF58 domain-containing protein [Sulfurovum sp.]|nr:DUF58 domain-containing protein [Sulfurovum sp.]MCB4761114.1 DUF58 domain-containing protein [Sulfurovum sp.]MCB4762464.1 DUF58 domain-containing protein [Sulfurovum sp.]MCB4772240.1 DUF58 domain-containing protein [Sulfurovum sp.]MCB4773829.1 DUF58 domain-containing protein [Sulfurovum sp.]
MAQNFKTLLLKSRQNVYTLLSGHSLSKLRGEGHDFVELREYQVGDDIRKINWIITAKLGKPYIKELYTNKELSVVVATLMDGGVYCNKDNAKQEIMTEVVATLGYAVQHNNDLFTGIGYTPKKIFSTPPTKQLFDIEHFSQQLNEAMLMDASLDICSCTDDLFKRIEKPSLLFILYDFLEPIDLSLLAQRHEVIAIIIRHQDEEFPQHKGEVILHHPKTGRKKHTYISKHSTVHYLTQRKMHDEAIIKTFSRHNIRYVKILTEEEPIEKLLTLF